MTFKKSRVRESRTLGSVRAKPNGLATRLALGQAESDKQVQVLPGQSRSWQPGTEWCGPCGNVWSEAYTGIVWGAGSIAPKFTLSRRPSRLATVKAVWAPSYRECEMASLRRGRGPHHAQKAAFGTQEARPGRRLGRRWGRSARENRSTAPS